MKAIREKLGPAFDGHPELSERYYIFCPACYEVYKGRYPDDTRSWDNGAVHCFSAKIHQFDGNLEQPTVSPSLLCSYTNNTTAERSICHSFVKAGKIQYLGDCTHGMANQTVDLMDVPQSFVEGMQ